MVAHSFEGLRAWQLARAFKLRIYQLIGQPPLVLDQAISKQLREAAASAQSNIAEGFGRFDPGDFGRMVKIARASIVECRNHLIDAVDRELISEETRADYDNDASGVLAEMGGLLDYLQSPEAKRNAEHIRHARFERRRRRITNSEARTENSER